MDTEDGAVVKSNTAQGPLAEKDRATLQKIIKRVNPQTGTLGEEVAPRTGLLEVNARGHVYQG